MTRGLAAVHNQLGTIRALLEYALARALRAEDLMGPERLEKIPGPTRRKLVRFKGPRGEALMGRAMQLVRTVLSYIRL